MSNFGIYMIGVVVVVAALAYGAHLVGISSTWIAVGALVVIGLSVMGGIVKTRRPEPPSGG
ncbi:MAG TPA: hypothetical protein VGS22_17570 [Thermoanaerobaculia bacterium]|jgi:hypothetical protein|nr:hypothetical protein [Thermoanaerobaculia bacterium]